MSFGSGLTKRDHEAGEHERDPEQPRPDEVGRIDLAMREERPEDERAPDRAGHGAEEDERHAARPPVRREHLGRGGARELDDPTRAADQRQPEPDDPAGVGRAAAGDDGAADRTADERGADDRHPSEPVADPSGRADRERARREEDRRPEAEDPLDAGDRDERQRAERR
jgi:hypothetical protein